MLRNRKLSTLVMAAACACLLVPLASHAIGETTWEPLSDEDGIQVWRANIEGSPVVAMRGAGNVDAPMTLVASVIHDTPRCPEWVSDLCESRVVKAPSETDRVVYQRVKTPWPIDDREFLFAVKCTFDAVAHQIVYDMHSIEDASVPRIDGVVRGDLKRSFFTLTSLGDGTKTRLEVEVIADPMGSIPKWVVNLAQKSWPRDTIECIRRQVKKPDVHELESVANLTSQAQPSLASKPAASGR